MTEAVTEAAEPETVNETVTEPEPEAEAGTRWTEPRYVAAEPVRDYYTPTGPVYQEPPKKEKPQKEKKSHPFLRAVAIVLACAIFSGAASYGVVTWVLDHRSATTTQVVLGSQAAVASADKSTEMEPATVATVGSDAELSPAAIYANACNYQVVGVNTSVNTRNFFGYSSTQAVSGTGFVISKDGYIMTNYHVISYAVSYGGELTVLFEDGTTVKAESIVGYSSDNDVAVIKIDPTGLDLNPVTFGDSDEISVGEQIYAIGNPLGELTFSMTPGIVSALDRVITTTDDITGAAKSINMFQVSAPVNSGNSGGPIYNAKGEVIGVVTAKYASSGVEGLGFAIPINDALNIARQLIEKGYITGASLGVTVVEVEDIYSTMAIQSYGVPDGVIIYGVNEGSAAEKAGIRKDDIVTAVNGTEVSSIDELKLALRKLTPGDEGTITVYRMKSMGDGETLELSIVFDESQTVSPSTDSDLGTTPKYEQGSGDDGASSWGEFFR